MLSRLMKFQVEHQNRDRGVSAHLTAVNPAATAASTMHKTLSAGMGTSNFIKEILDIFAVLDKDRKQQLINYSSRLVEQQRAEQRENRAHRAAAERANKAAPTANLEQMAQRLAASRVSDSSEAVSDFSKTASDRLSQSG